MILIIMASILAAISSFNVSPTSLGYLTTGISQSARKGLTQTSSATPASTIWFPALPPNTCPNTLPIQRFQTRPATTLNDVARVMSSLAHIVGQASSARNLKDTCPFILPIQRHQGFPTSTLNDIARFVTLPVESQGQNPTLASIRSANFFDILSVLLASIMWSSYIVFAKFCWNLHHSHRCLYGREQLLLNRSQRRRAVKMLKRRQGQERLKHIQLYHAYRTRVLPNFQSELDQKTATINSSQTKLADCTAQNNELRAEMDQKVERQQHQIEELKSTLEAIREENRLNEQLLASRDAVISQLHAKLIDAKAAFALETQFGRDGRWSDMYDTAWAQHTLQIDLARKSTLISQLKGQVTEANSEVHQLKLDVQQAAHSYRTEAEIVGSLKSEVELLLVKSTRDEEEIARLMDLLACQGMELDRLKDTSAASDCTNDQACPSIPIMDVLRVSTVDPRADLVQSLESDLSELSNVIREQFSINSSPTPPTSPGSSDSDSSTSPAPHKDDLFKDDKPRGLDASIWAPKPAISTTFSPGYSQKSSPVPRVSSGCELNSKPQGLNASMWAPKPGGIRMPLSLQASSSNGAYNRQRGVRSHSRAAQPSYPNGSPGFQMAGRVYNAIGLGTKSSQDHGYRLTEDYGSHFNTPRRHGPQHGFNFHDKR